ncbi:hypothetical protein ABZ863_21045 [Saccharomonospora sp. NPDC046836]|uniref:DUF7677 family protein n=1 Tax=Saccharomonospora sp. NPDC046836 TaxID=3156921 RepID=UPI0033D5CC35
MQQIPEGVRGAIRFFAFFVGNGTLDQDVLSDVDDYRPALFKFGSALEKVFAVYTNVLEYDEAGMPTNDDWAAHRAAQWIRSYLDHDYEVEPPFEDWEVELH